MTDRSLHGLSDQQVEAIVRLSETDEEYTLKKYVGDIHSKYDKAVEDVLGLLKPKGQKTYRWFKGEVFPTIRKVFS